MFDCYDNISNHRNYKKEVITMAKKKNHIFSGSGEYGVKFSGKWGKLNAAERTHRNLMQGIFNTKNVKDISSKAIKDLKSVLKSMGKAVNEKFKSLKNAGLTTPATLNLEESGGEISTKSDDLSDLIGEYIRAKDFLDDETSTEEGAEEFEKEVAHDADKWTILRRLAKIDPRIKIDTSYGSQVLHEIEMYIAEGQYDINEITDIMIGRLDDIARKRENSKNNMNKFR